MILRSYFVWVTLWMVACRCLANPALENLAGFVPDHIKSITMLCTTTGALLVTFAISKNADNKKIYTALKKWFVVFTTILTALDAVVIVQGDPVWRYILEKANHDLIIPFFDIMYIEIRQKEAGRLGISFSTLVAKMSFPKCLVMTIAGLVAVWIYQPTRGMTIENALWLMWSAGAVADGAIAFGLYTTKE